MNLLGLLGRLFGFRSAIVPSPTSEPEPKGSSDTASAMPPPTARRRSVRRACRASGAWMVQYEHLAAYRRLHPDDWPRLRECFPLGNRLGLWCFHQRRSQKSGRLQPDRLDLLNELRFPWDGTYYWYRQYQFLVAFRQKHPSRWPACREEWPPGNDLGNWCHWQRTAHRKGQLRAGKIDLLNLIGFEWVSTYHNDIARTHWGRRR